MASFREVAPTAVKGSGEELPGHEEDAAVEEPYYRTAERRHLDILLEISEEESLKELEPHKYHCYCGWEEAARGWDRVAPLSCILLTQKKHGKQKHKEADNQPALSVDPTLSNADSPASIAEDHCESHAGPSFKKSTFLNQQAGSWHDAALAALQLDAPERTVLNVMQKTASHLLREEKIEEEKMLRKTLLESHNLSSKYSVSEYRDTKPQKHSHGPISTAVPIKNFTFLPLITSPYLNPKFGGQLCIGRKSSEGESLDENGSMFNKKSRTRGTSLIPALHSSTAVGSQARMHSS